MMVTLNIPQKDLLKAMQIENKKELGAFLFEFIDNTVLDWDTFINLGIKIILRPLERSPSLYSFEEILDLLKKEAEVQGLITEPKFPRKALVTNIVDGLGSINNDEKYIGRAKNRIVTLLDEIKPNFFITDFYLPEYRSLRNDYIRDGFLIVTKENIKLVEVKEK